ncbi:MAG: 3'-5' exonuclease [Firmicutes bacterium]|nr:3'-5' exonuclease [Candidatus Caballimonas caccae]
MIIYLDTETTGLYPGNICELSYIMQDKDKVKAKNFFFTVDFVEFGAYSVHGFSVELLKELSNGKRFKDFFYEIKEDFDSADMLIAHNLSFDSMFLRAEFENIGEEFNYDKTFCSMKNSVEACKLPRNRGLGYKYPKLSELCEFLEIDDMDLRIASQKLYGESCSFHDARFDTTALYLAVNKGMDKIEKFKFLRDLL